MAKDNWLTLMEYSNLHKVSISTLRRKIKSNDLTFQFTDGKYFILDDSLPTQRPASGPETIVPPKGSATQDQEPQAPKAQKSEPERACDTAKTLLQEVKRAYSMVLQEKEEQILQLKEEVSDLQTLVRVLENEVQRLNASVETARENAKSVQQIQPPQELSIQNLSAAPVQTFAQKPEVEQRSKPKESSRVLSSSSLADMDFDLELDQF